jgi:hypothetical protein
MGELLWKHYIPTPTPFVSPVAAPGTSAVEVGRFVGFPYGNVWGWAAAVGAVVAVGVGLWLLWRWETSPRPSPRVEREGRGKS